jgi:heme exporter protein C
MNMNRRVAAWIFWLLTLTLLAVSVAMTAFYVPIEATMGPIQKIFYLHLPVAINTFLACAVVCVGSVGYIWQRKVWWDELAQAGGQVAVLFATVVLVTGMIWAHHSWGQWWTWSPRLTFSLLLWMLYVVYLLVRISIESPQRRALVAAVFGMIAFLDVPLVYVSVRLLPDIHPTSVTLTPPMQLTLTVWFAATTLLCVGLIWGRANIGMRMRSQNRSATFDDQSVSHSSLPPTAALGRTRTNV